MKKNIFLIGICAIIIMMPALGALTLQENDCKKNNLKKDVISKFSKPSVDEYDGTILGGLGVIYKEDEEWDYDIYSYIVGVYKNKGNRKTIYCNIYNLDKEKTGTLRANCGRSIIIGLIKNLEEDNAPIIGLLFERGEKFAGRIMSLFGPAPHIWGKYDST
jgi:hypothetical protein